MVQFWKSRITPPWMKKTLPDAGHFSVASHATALGDGAQIHRDLLEGAGFKVPGERSALHRVSAGSICRIAAAGAGSSAAAPIYLRRPDAERSLAAGR